MHFHTFNIGMPHLDAWWARNRQLGIITAGFDGELGDRGNDLLHQMDEGDWVIAYSNGHGFVGAGKVGSVATYHLLSDDELPHGWESTHRHSRRVDWVYVVSKLVDAIPAAEVRRQAPRQTKERLPNEIGSVLVRLLAERSHADITREILSDFTREFATSVEQSKRDTPDARNERLRVAPREPKRAPVLTYEFVRNPDVVAEILHRANGKCERCNSPAPFIRRSDGSPYLEVHHKIPLADNGEDSVENAIALCPNCHRELHYGASNVVI